MVLRVNATGGGDRTAAKNESHHEIDGEMLPESASGLAVKLVGGTQRVLLIGDTRAPLVAALISNGCSVVAVPQDAGKADQLATNGALVIAEPVHKVLADVSVLGVEPFDVVLCIGFFEHLVDPAAGLRSLLSVLSPMGFVVAVVPNIAHIDARLALMNGHFPFTQNGAGGPRNVRFFTRETLATLLDQCGLVALDVERTYAVPFSTELNLQSSDFDPGIVERLVDEPDAETYQFVVRSMRRSADVEIGRVLKERSQMAFEANSNRRRAVQIQSLEARVETLLAELDQARQAIADAQRATADKEHENLELQARLKRLAPVERVVTVPWVLTVGRRIKRIAFGSRPQ